MLIFLLKNHASFALALPLKKYSFVKIYFLKKTFFCVLSKNKHFIVATAFYGSTQFFTSCSLKEEKSISIVKLHLL